MSGERKCRENMPACLPLYLLARNATLFSSHSSNEGEQVAHFELPPLGEGEEGAQVELDNQRAEHFSRVSQELKPNFPTKYWA
jgi:hypothetical protein